MNLMMTMTAPMPADQIQSFMPTIRAAGIAGIPTPLSLRQPLFMQSPASNSLRGREMITQAAVGEVPDMDKR